MYKYTTCSVFKEIRGILYISIILHLLWISTYNNANMPARKYWLDSSQHTTPLNKSQWIKWIRKYTEVREDEGQMVCDNDVMTGEHLQRLLMGMKTTDIKTVDSKATTECFSMKTEYCEMAIKQTAASLLLFPVLLYRIWKPRLSEKSLLGQKKGTPKLGSCTCYCRSVHLYVLMTQ